MEAVPQSIQGSFPSGKATTHPTHIFQRVWGKLVFVRLEDIVHHRRMGGVAVHHHVVFRVHLVAALDSWKMAGKTFSPWAAFGEGHKCQTKPLYIESHGAFTGPANISSTVLAKSNGRSQAQLCLPGNRRNG